MNEQNSSLDFNNLMNEATAQTFQAQPTPVPPIPPMPEQPNTSFNISSTPIFAESIEPGEVGENIFTYMKSKSNILKITDLQQGEFFSGLVYCTRLFCSSNVNEINKYDITMTLIDGDGIQFTGKKWGADQKMDNIETPVYIEGTTISYGDNVIRYRIDTIKRYTTGVPKSLFIKEIDNLRQEKEKLLGYVSEVETPCLKVLLNDLLSKQNYIETLLTTTYTATVGTRLGAKILIANTAISIMDTMRQTLYSNLNRDIYISLVVLHMIDLAIKQSMMDSTQQTSIQMSTMIMSSMFNSGCFSVKGEEKEVIQKICNGMITFDKTKEVYTVPSECLILNNAIQTIERALRCKQAQDR